MTSDGRERGSRTAFLLDKFPVVGGIFLDKVCFCLSLARGNISVYLLCLINSFIFFFFTLFYPFFLTESKYV